MASLLSRVTCGGAVLVFAGMFLALGVRKEVVECDRAADVCRISMDYRLFKNSDEVRISDIVGYVFVERSKRRGHIALTGRAGREIVVAAGYDEDARVQFERLGKFLGGEGPRVRLVTGPSTITAWVGVLFVFLAPLGFIKGWGRR